jgi:hypothetical protein
MKSAPGKKREASSPGLETRSKSAKGSEVLRRCSKITRDEQCKSYCTQEFCAAHIPKPLGRPRKGEAKTQPEVRLMRGAVVSHNDKLTRQSSLSFQKVEPKIIYKDSNSQTIPTIIAKSDRSCQTFGPMLAECATQTEFITPTPSKQPKQQSIVTRASSLLIREDFITQTEFEVEFVDILSSAYTGKGNTVMGTWPWPANGPWISPKDACIGFPFVFLVT